MSGKIGDILFQFKEVPSSIDLDYLFENQIALPSKIARMHLDLKISSEKARAYDPEAPDWSGNFFY